MRGNDTPSPIWIISCTVVGIWDLVVCANFGDNRIRLGVAGVKFCHYHRLSSSSLQYSCTTARVRDAVFILLTSLQYHEKAHILKTPHCGFRPLYLHASVRNPTPFLDWLEHWAWNENILFVVYVYEYDGAEFKFRQRTWHLARDRLELQERKPAEKRVNFSNGESQVWIIVQNLGKLNPIVRSIVTRDSVVCAVFTASVSVRLSVGHTSAFFQAGGTYHQKPMSRGIWYILNAEFLEDSTTYGCSCC